MSIPSRNADPRNARAHERTFLVSSTTWGRRALLQTERSAGLFIDLLYEYRAAGKYLLHGFVVMPEHFHALITVGSEMTVEKAAQLIKGGFAYRAARAFGLPKPVWQKGFSEIRILDEESFVSSRRYIHENPVRKGLVVRPEDFPFSSANERYQVDPHPSAAKAESSQVSNGAAKAVP